MSRTSRTSNNAASCDPSRPSTPSAVPAASSPASLPATAPAVLQIGYGGPEVLRLAEHPLPQLEDADVLVQVRAAGLARGAWHLMTGKPYLLRAAFGLRRPRQPVSGHNLAGTVAAVGAAVTRFRVGDEVFGIGRGTFAGFSAAAEEKLALKPAGLDFQQAAVVPVSGLTALQALDAARVAAGMKVLVLGAAGGVGSFAVQMARAAGAEVTGACSAGKAEFVRSLGAAATIDYTREDFASAGPRFDAIIDVGGNPSPARLRRALVPGGTAVLAGGEGGNRLTGAIFERQAGGAVLSLFGNRRLKGLMCRENGKDLERVSAMIEADEVTPRIDSRYPLADVAAAMNRLESGLVQGSVVLLP
ncbi:NAD(P)-dependent alcohol dehydrogenase [Arthrobacter gengyunqii]|uniref:NAD(P)-dependent alcohol dehydrogenase n=1 Tax=Arthrobacter gengyunqii TaxID=2886940 RepID=A0ABS8GNW0_9MICC|nr:NAD(P)-dependent alcohol dehydrogenase [Arthrobacter gengyunqii]MCC3266958.1 NAD(P)-dependent alcohol dehydrogenase [Arthrobacter gengyunqii]